MAIIERRGIQGSVSYQVKVRDSAGNWQPTKTFSDYAEALNEEARLIRAKRKGARMLSDDAKRVTVGEFWEVWAQENRTDVSAGWKQSQDQLYRDYVAPALAKRIIGEIRAPEIGRTLARVSELGKSDQTRKHVYSLLRKLFADAVEYYEMLAVSPVKAKFHRPKVREQKRAFLPPEKAWELLEHSRGSYLGPAVWLGMLSALRISEVQALKWECLHFESEQILIRAAFNKKTGEMQPFPKQKDWAYAPMPRVLAVYLGTLGRVAGDFVAQSESGGMLPYDTFIKAIKRLCREAGVPEITPHELRHSATELYVEGGASTEDLRRLLNHKSLGATRRYIHRTDERLTRIAGSLKPALRAIGGNTV